MRQKTARRYYKHKSLHALFHGRDVSDCPSAIEGHIDEDGERKPAPATFKIEGEERGKEEGTALAATTTAPAQLACHAGGVSCDCGLQLSCKAARCACCWVGHNCVSCQCLVRCANVAPQNQQEEQRTTQRGPGDGEGQQRGKRRRGWGRAAAAKARACEAGRVVHAETNQHASG